FVERPVAVGHAPGNIDHERATEVGLFLVLLDVEPVLAGPDLPIDVPQVVAGDIFAMLQELDGLPEVRAAVHPRKKSFDDAEGPNFQPRDALDRLRMQKSF